MSASTHPPLERDQSNLPPGTPPRKKRRTGWIWLVVALALAAAAWYAYKTAPAPSATGAGKKGKGGKGGAGGDLPVAVAKARLGNLPIYLNGLGSVQAFYTVTVRSRVDGQLMNVAYKEGDFVKEGQVLAQVDPRPFQVQLEQAEGQMARDQALLANARLDLQRYQTLLAQDAIPKQQLDTQGALVAQYTGNIKTDQAAIDNARLQLTYAKVTAPISGRVGLRLVDPGNIVHAADVTGLLIITQLQPISAVFTIPEDNLPAVLKKLRSGVALPVDAYNRDNTQKLDSGRLVTVDNQIDSTTGTSKLKAVFPNANSALFPNQFVNVRMLVDTLNGQVLAPEVAIQQGAQGPFVYVVGEDSKVTVTPVQPGAIEGSDAQIISGLNAGDMVVVDGTDKLQNGSRVRVQAPRGGAPPGGRGGRGGRGAGKKGAAPSTGAPAPASTSDGGAIVSVPPGGDGKQSKGNRPKQKENQ